MSKLVDQPSRSEGAELEAAIKQWEHDGSRLLDVIDGAKAVITALRQAKLQAEHEAEMVQFWHREYDKMADERDTLRADLAAANTDRDRFGDELLAVIAERDAANEQRDQYIQWHHDVGTLLLAERERVRELEARG